MKNLKKVLSLALVFAMVLGLCIGAMAADTQDVTELTDWGNVAHKNAAQLLNAFNIMQGYPDKTFRPGNTVTRAEAVKMIDVGLWGGIDQADRFVSTDSQPFSDVKSTDWFAGHVTYAETLGILDGFPDGTFRPNDTVTGYQLLKMALIALNYNSEVEGLAGAGWDIRTMRLATDPSAGAYLTNLTAGLSEITNWNAPLTRDQAAQIISNMIQHSYISYNLNQNGQVGNIKTYGRTFGETFLGLTTETGRLVANAYGNITGVQDPQTNDVTYTTIDPKRSSDNTLVEVTRTRTTTDPVTNTTTSVSYPAYQPAQLESTLADIGSPVTLYYKSGVLVGAALNGWTAIEADKDASGNVTNYEDGHTKANDVTFGDPKTADYIVTTYVDTDGDNFINYVVTTCYGKAVAVKDVTSTTNYGTVYQVTDLKWRSSYENNDVNPAQFVVESEASFTAKKGDVIAYTNQPNVYQDKTATYGVVLDPVSGTVSRVVNNTTTNTHTVTIDGVAYPLVQSLLKDGKENADGTIPFGAEGTFYLYPDNSIGKFDGKVTQTETHYALIYDADFSYAPTVSGIHTSNTKAAVQVCAILDDGTSGVYAVNGIWQDIGELTPDGNGGTKGKSTLVKVSDFTYSNIDGDSSKAAIKADVNGDGTIGDNETIPHDGFFSATAGKNNELYKINNNNASKANLLATYTVNDDGSLNLTFVPADSSVSLTNNTSKVEANNPSLISTSKYFTGKTMTFVQTKKDGTDEAWTVAVGLPTSNYVITDNTKVQVYTGGLFETTDKNSITAIVLNDGAKEATQATKTDFMYVLADNGQTGIENSIAIHEVTVYNSKTNTVETIKAQVGFTVGTIYQAYDETTKKLDKAVTIENPGTTANNAGFITRFSDNVIGLSVVTAAAQPNATPAKDFETDTKAYVVNSDTKYYIIDGASSTSVSASEISTQGVLDWGIDPETKLQTVEYYQTVIIPVGNTNTAEHVIVFATEQIFD